MTSKKQVRTAPKPQVRSEDADKYFDAATDWDLDQKARNLRESKHSLIVAGVCMFGLLLSVGSNFMLFPLKESVYSIVRVDSVTGLVDVQRTLSDGKETYSEATDKYWLRMYVRERESFMYARYDNQYRTIGLLSSAQEQKKWYEFFRPENPAAPVNQLGQRGTSKVSIRSVAFIDKGLATVRFTKTIEQFNGTPTQTFWIATVKYRYVNAPIGEADREINPLGFQVAEYRIDPETDVAVEAPKL